MVQSESGGWDYDVAVVSTAALPWQTGPSYLALWPACGLAARGLRVVLVVPWVGPRGQARLWRGPRFATPQEQAEWLAAEAARLGCRPLPDLRFYRGHASGLLRSILPLEDVFGAVPRARATLLLEPEHLCWYPRTRRRRAVASRTVAGLLYTNYEHYLRAGAGPLGPLLGSLATRVHRRLVRRHTDWVVPMSPAVAAVAAGHATRQARVSGVAAAYAAVPPVGPATRGIYFLGRLVWDKGLETVIEVARRTRLPVDLLGDGPDAAAIRARAVEQGAPLRFLGPCARPWTRLADYRVFLNPSLSEVLCSTTAEALVAGRHVVLADCPANEPFRGYPNAHFFRDPAGAEAALRRALATPPEAPTAVRRDFDWDLACERLAGLLLDDDGVPAGAAPAG